MEFHDLNSLPTLNTFKGLEIGNKVYTNANGLGKVIRLHKDEVIVNFNGNIRRLAEDDKEVKLVPKEMQESKKPTVTAQIGEKKIGFRTLKKQIKADVEQNFLTIPQTANILEISRDRLMHLIAKHNVEIHHLNNKQMISKQEIKKLLSMDLSNMR